MVTSDNNERFFIFQRSLPLNLQTKKKESEAMRKNLLLTSAMETVHNIPKVTVANSNNLVSIFANQTPTYLKPTPLCLDLAQCG